MLDDAGEEPLTQSLIDFTVLLFGGAGETRWGDLGLHWLVIAHGGDSGEDLY